MATIGELKKVLAAYSGRDNVNDLNPVNFTPAGPDIDLGLYALNAARRKAERMRDFKYAEIDCFLSIGALGGNLSNAYVGGSLTVTGTLSPNIAGSFTVSGNYNGAPFYTLTTGGVTYFLFFTGTAWQIRPGAFSGSNGWNYATSSLNPAGTYVATGTSTGTATVAGSTASVLVKRLQKVALPIAGGKYQPIEFLTTDEYEVRLKRQAGRIAYDSGDTQAEVGIYQGNALAHQQGQVIFLEPASTLSLPITVQLGVVQFMPDYVGNSDRDFFCDYAPEYLQFQGLLELNKLFRRFIPKQEGNVDERAIEAMAQEALQSLIMWDDQIAASTSTPAQQEQPRKK